MKFWERWDNIAYMWTNGILQMLPDSYTDRISPKQFIKKIKLVLKHVSADSIRLFKKDTIPKDKIWFLVLTKNNYDSLKDVQARTTDSILVSFFRFRSTINKETFYYHLKGRFLWDLIYPFMLFWYTVKRPSKGLRYFDLLVSVNGTFEESLTTIRNSKPRGIVFTNDHLVEARSMLLAALHQGIPTYYIPHASVSTYFPPLEFDYALLDGQDTLDKYKACGPVRSKVKLLGMPKFDKYTNDGNEASYLTVLGIAYNMVDEIQDVLGLVNLIFKENPQLTIILRPHPGDTRKLSNIPNGVMLSNSKTEDSFSYLKRIDALVAGESSIHLEAVLLNVYPLHFCFSNNIRFDYYGFIKNGLVENCSGVREINQKISELIKEKPSIRARAKYYNAAIGTDFYGKTCQKMAEIIDQKSIPVNDKK